MQQAGPTLSLQTNLERRVRQLMDDCFARAKRSRHQSDLALDEREQHGWRRRVPSPVLTSRSLADSGAERFITLHGVGDVLTASDLAVTQCEEVQIT